MRPTLTTACLALSPLFAGCGPSTTPADDCCAEPAAVSCATDPQAVAERFLAAARAADSDALTALVTPGAADAFRGGYELDTERLGACELGAVSIDGDDASVALVCSDSDGERSVDLLLRKDGDWRVRGLRAALGERQVEIDFEELAGLAEQMAESLAEGIGEGMQEAFDDAQRTWEQGGTPAEIAARRARFEALAPVEPAELEQNFRIDVDGDGRSLAAVLTEVLAPSGLDFEPHAALDAVTTARLEGLSRVEAVERLAAEAGLHPRWPSLQPVGFGAEAEVGVLTFAEGPRPLPATFAGPFVIEVTELVEEAPNAVGSIELTARALDLPAAVLAFQDEASEVLAVERLRAGETPLTDESMHVWTTPSLHAGYFVYAIDRELTGLLASVEAIDELTGTVRLPLPAEIESVTLEAADGGPDERAVELGTLRATAWAADVQFELEASADAADERLEGVQLRMSPRDAAGEPLGVRFSSSSGWGRQLSASLQCPEPPAAVDLKICTVEPLVLPFELGPIPLARHAEQPERLAELEFDGAEPLEVAILERHSGEHGDEVTLRATNRSNKDAIAVVVDFDYLDASGAKLDDFMHSLSGDWDFDRERFGPFVAAGATHEAHTHAAFVPAGTVTIRARLRSVEFPDGTTWESTVGAR